MNRFEHKTNNAIFKYKTSKKQKYFEYFVLSLCEAWLSGGKDFEQNDLCILKVQLLLFSTVAKSAKINDDGLLKIFNNWVALPHGHIEQDIADIIIYKKGIFDLFKIDGKRVTITN